MAGDNSDLRPRIAPISRRLSHARGMEGSADFVVFVAKDQKSVGHETHEMHEEWAAPLCLEDPWIR
jgi:hypothetical protein